jgi:V/A-type H+-transporting ATPase subunit I
MPIARMAKISLLAPCEDSEKLVERLHSLGAVQVSDIATAAQQDDDLKGMHECYEPKTRELRLAMARSEFSIDLLESFEDKKSGLVSGFLKERIHLDYGEFMAIESEIDLDGVYRELESLDVELRHIESRIAEMRDELEDLRPWKKIPFPLSELDDLERTIARRLRIASSQMGSWEEEMQSLCPYSTWDEIYREGERVFLLLLMHRHCLDDFEETAQRHDAETLQFEGKAATPEEEIKTLEEKISEELKAKEGIEERIKENIPLKPKLLALNDLLYNRLIKEEVKGNFIHTERVVAVEGWVEENRVGEIREELSSFEESLDVDFSRPAEDDSPPVLLVNRRRIRPGETLIQLFGIPDHSETDPTPFVSVFFILFFGMCIGDVGYGLVLATLLWLAMNKLDISKAAKKFLRLFFYCAIASIVVGVFTRGYFGIEGEILPGFLKFAGTTDILYDPVPIMLICLALGLIHISIGVAIEMYDNMRHNSVWLGICEQGTTLLSWLGIAVAAVGFGVGLQAVGRIGAFIVMAGVAGIVFLSNISSKSLAGKFFGGLYNLYGLFASTIGDVASYLRLYALGLATVAVALVINKMAAQVWGIPVLGIILVIAILLGGHVFNLAISFLSAFVHPLRLQYVEFFGKFYDDGGEAFAPFALDMRKTVIDDR